MRLTRTMAILCAAGTIGAAANAQSVVRSLYVTNNVGSPGSVAAFEVNPTNGAMTFLETAAAGFNPQGIALMPDGRYAIVINGTQNAVVEDVFALPILADGSFGAPAAPTLYPDGNLSLTVTKDGWIIIPSVLIDGVTSSFVNAQGRVQEVDRKLAGTFPICATSTPDGKFVYVAGSGVNNLYSFSINADTGVLTSLGAPTGTTTIFALQTHPFLPVLYGSTGLQNVIQAYDIDPDTGALTFRAAYSSGGGNSAVEMAVHPTGNYLYVCHVVSDTLQVLPINPDGSIGASIQSILIGSDIRDVATDGEYVYVTDESSISGSPVGVIVYKIENDGTLTQTAPAYPTNGGRPQFMAVWVPPVTKCPGDANGDQIVNFADLNEVLSAFGQAGADLPADLNNDGVVNFADLNIVLSNFGNSCV